jgi:uncharacterized protein YjdB
MSDLAVTVEPQSLELRPGMSAEVTVSVEPTTGGGKAVFPVRSSKGQGRGVVQLNLTEAVVFMDPRTEPGNLPVQIELLDAGATSATFRITAQEPKLKRSDRRRARRDG